MPTDSPRDEVITLPHVVEGDDIPVGPPEAFPEDPQVKRYRELSERQVVEIIELQDTIDDLIGQRDSAYGQRDSAYGQRDHAEREMANNKSVLLEVIRMLIHDRVSF